MFARTIAIAACLLVSVSAWAVNDTYVVVAPGYGELDTGFGDEGDFSYKLGFGYQFHRQWYVEVGYQQLADDLPAVDTLVQRFQAGETAVGVEADALYLGLLGKATGQSGELFYRVGAMRADVRTVRAVEATDPCLTNNPLPVCETDNSALAGVVGIGFDFRASRKMMVRFEIEHVRGEDSLEMNGAFLGLRYNF